MTAKPLEITDTPKGKQVILATALGSGFKIRNLVYALGCTVLGSLVMMVLYYLGMAEILLFELIFIVFVFGYLRGAFHFLDKALTKEWICVNADTLIIVKKTLLRKQTCHYAINRIRALEYRQDASDGLYGADRILIGYDGGELIFGHLLRREAFEQIRELIYGSYNHKPYDLEAIEDREP